jgi:hypothetical protein
VLGGVAGFFVFLARRSARVPLPVDGTESLPAEQSTGSAMITASTQSASTEIVFARGNLGSSGLAHRRGACSRTRGSGAGNPRSTRGRS